MKRLRKSLIVLFFCINFLLIFNSCGLQQINESDPDIELNSVTDALYTLSFDRLDTESLDKNYGLDDEKSIKTANDSFVFYVCTLQDQSQDKELKKYCVNAFRDSEGKGVVFDGDSVLELTLEDAKSLFVSFDSTTDDSSSKSMQMLANQINYASSFDTSSNAFKVVLGVTAAAATGTAVYKAIKTRNDIRYNDFDGLHPFSNELDDEIISKNASERLKSQAPGKSSSFADTIARVDNPEDSIHSRYGVAINQFDSSVSSINEKYKQKLSKVLYHRAEGAPESLLLKNINIHTLKEDFKVNSANTLDELLSTFDAEMIEIDKNYFADTLDLHSSEVALNTFLKKSKEAKEARLKYQFLLKRIYFEEGAQFVDTLDKSKKTAISASKEARFFQDIWIDDLNKQKLDEIDRLSSRVKGTYDHFVKKTIGSEVVKKRQKAIYKWLRRTARDSAPFVLGFFAIGGAAVWVIDSFKSLGDMSNSNYQPAIVSDSQETNEVFELKQSDLIKVLDKKNDYSVDRVVDTLKSIGVFLQTSYFETSKISSYCLPRKIPGQVISKAQDKAFCIKLN